jgi:hypothetical protein
MQSAIPALLCEGAGAKALGDFSSPGAPFSSDGGRPHMKRAPGRGARRPCASALAPGGESGAVPTAMGYERGIAIGRNSIYSGWPRCVAPSRRNLAQLRQAGLRPDQRREVPSTSSCTLGLADWTHKARFRRANPSPSKRNETPTTGDLKGGRVRADSAA